MFKHLRSLVAVAFFFVLLSTASGASPDYVEIPIPLLGFELTDTELKIIVPQNGGTAKASLRFDLQKTDESQVLTIFRTTRDECKMVTQRETFSYPLKDLGIEPRKPLRISNSIFGDEIFAGFHQKELEKKASLDNQPENKTTGSSFKSRVEAAFQGVRMKKANATGK